MFDRTVIKIIGILFLSLYCRGQTLTASELSSSTTAFNLKSHKFPNGLELIVLENHRAPLIVHIMGFKVGTNESPLGKSGLAHYLEHLMFKAYPNIDKEIHRLGGEFNAQTSSDYTFYYEIVPKNGLETVLELDSDRMKNLVIEESWARPEIDVILEERRMRVDNSMMGKFSESLNLMEAHNHPSRLPVIGWAHEIKSYTSQDAQRFYQDYYAPNNAFIVIAGDIKFEEAKTLVENYYGSIPVRPIPAKIQLVEPTDIQTRQTLEMNSPLVDQPIYLRRYQAPNFHQNFEKFCALLLLEIILGQDMVGRFTRVLVEEKHLAQYFQVTYLGLSSGPGSFQFIMSSAQNISISTLERAFALELEKVLKKGISKTEFDKAKETILAQKIYTQDGIIGNAQDIATLLGNGMTVEEIDSYFNHINHITLRQVNDVLREVLQNPYHIVGRLNPIDSSTSGKSLS